MDVYVVDRKLRLAMGDEATRKRLYGDDMAKKLTLRFAALQAAESLADFWPPNSGPERCHELKGGRKGNFSVDVKQPYRLLFRPSPASPLPEGDELGRWKSITSIDILGIEDTHG